MGTVLPCWVVIGAQFLKTFIEAIDTKGTKKATHMHDTIIK